MVQCGVSWSRTDCRHGQVVLLHLLKFCIKINSVHALRSQTIKRFADVFFCNLLPLKFQLYDEI